MEQKMSAEESQGMGNFGVERGEQYAKRTWRDLSAPRARRIPDVSFDKRARGVFASWKANGGRGPYASRAIANAAQGLQFPLRQVHRDGVDAIRAGTPLRLVEEAAFIMLDAWREEAKRGASAITDRPEPPTPSGGAMPVELLVTGETRRVA